MSVQDERTIGSEEAVYMESLKKDLEGVLAGLSVRDAGVLRMRFGLLDGREYTLDEVGAEFKVGVWLKRGGAAKACGMESRETCIQVECVVNYQLASCALGCCTG